GGESRCPAAHYFRAPSRHLYNDNIRRVRLAEPRRSAMPRAAESSAPVAGNDHPDPKHNVDGARQAYYDRISKFNMAPLWEKLRQVVGNEPKTQCAPGIWRFADVKAMVMESADLISSNEAERRVLVLEN